MKRIAKGGAITVNSFLNEEDRVIARNHMLKTASTNMREAAKIGLQSLYADPKDVLEKYKDFDIVKEMQARKGAKLLWVRARAIDADTVNANGDYFSKAELLKEVEIKGEKIPAYKTFEGVPIYTNHKNDDIEQAKGMVVYAEWNDEENCVYCTFFVDEEAYPDIARNIRTGVIHDVSMGCFVPGTQILTENGFKNIEFVNVQDVLLDADAKLTQIENTQITYNKTHIHDISVEGGYGFECTEEHPILAIKENDWKKREKRITVSGIKSRHYDFVEPKFIEAKDLRVGDLVAVKTGGPIIESDLNINKAKLLGLFAAEGNYLKYKGEVKEIEFTFSIDEEFTLVSDCVELISEVFNKEARVYRREPKSTIIVRLYDEEIAKWFKYHIGQYSYGKSISKELRFASLNVQKAFICSWIKGDGCITHLNKKSQGISSTTSSIEFAKDITYILTRLGIYHKIYARFEQKTLLFKDAIKIHNNSKGFDGRMMSFDIEIPSYYAQILANDCNFEINNTVTQRKNFNEDYIVRKVKSNNSKPYSGPVYNFETESHTYTIHNIGVHNCSVDYGICSKCKNKAFTEKDYCECLKRYKGKTDPETNKKVYEENYNLKFIELSCVGDGAFEACEIKEIYDVDDVLDAANKLEKKANELFANIAIALEGSPREPELRVAYEDCLRVAKTTSNTAIRLSQSVGTLVGGQLLAGPGATQNSTVSAILTALGIDPRSGLNVLDLINLSLNFLEVGVMNLFARKDNVDLGHVGKITKAMADLQGTMQDMIDDGIDVGSGQRPQPINQPNQQAQQVQQQAASPQVGLASYTPGANVGKIMELTSPQEQMAVGGGVALASNNVNLVWASKDGKREVYASTNHSRAEKSNIERFTNSLLTLKNSLDNNINVQQSIDSVIRVANERNKNIKNNITPNMAGGRNQMDHFAKIASEQRKKLAAAVTIDFKVEDANGNRVVLSTDGSITGFTNGRKTNWDPILNENQLSLMEGGQGTRVAAELLKDYASFVKTALLDVKMREDVREENLEEVRTDVPYKSLGEGLSTHHKGVSGNTREEDLSSKQTGEVNEVKEKLLSDGAGLYGHKVNDPEVKKSLFTLVDEVTKGVPTEVIEKRLSECRAEGKASAHEVMSATINALGRAVVKAMETPSRILKVAQTLAAEPALPEMVGTAAAGAPMEAANSERAEFFDKEQEPMDSVTAVLKQLGAAVTSDITAQDLSDALSVAVEEGEITKEGVTRVAELLMKDVTAPEEGLDIEATPSKAEELRSALTSAIEGDQNLISKDDLKSAISAMAMSSEETGSTPDEVVDAVGGMGEKELVASISRAKTASATDARLRARARREFWGVRTASSKDIKSNVIGWLADYSTNFNISPTKIALAAKKLSEDFDVAERLVAKAIETKKSMEKTAAMTVTQEKNETLRFCCTCEDLGLEPNDPNFEDAFKQKAVSVLSERGFTVDPNTFTFTNLTVSAHGDVTATVSSMVTKSFTVEGEGSESPAEGMTEDAEGPIIMTDSARVARKQRRNEILNRYAQALPGMPPAAPAGPPAGPVDPTMGMGAPGTDPGVLGLTGAPAEAGDMDAMPDEGTTEAGEKKPWGSICPVCGSDDVNISESNADCQSCGSTYEIQMTLNLISKGDKGKASEEGEMPGLGGPDMGLGAATAPAETAPAAMPGMPPAPMAPTASVKSMFRLATKIDADVYLRTAMPDFNRETEKKLPIGMVCPSCGSRQAHKVKNNTFCYECGNYAKTTVTASKDNPSLLDVSITWID